VILVDANLLIYAYVESFAEHRIAQSWLDDRLNGSARVGLPWHSLLAFLRTVTNPRLFRQPVSTANAWRQVTDWLGNDSAWVPNPTDRHAEIFAAQVSLPGIQANLVHDAHLAALAIEHGLELCSTDGDFARFRELRWRNPLRD